MKFSNQSFTLVEILVIVGILVVLAALAVPTFRFFQKESDLANSAEEIINTLRVAQNKTLASEGASQYGVYFNNSITPHQYILFKGINYLLRDVSFDEIHRIPDSVEIFGINLGGGNEVVFARITGQTNQFGDISLRLKTNPAKTNTIYIESSGRIGLSVPSTPSDGERVKDSRHVHFDYSRAITTTAEDLTLTFEGGVTETIVIANNVRNSQIYWEGEVDVLGEIQKLKIHTHRLNDLGLGTQFCIHRDRRYNDKALKIEISGDTAGFLIQYDADGQTTKGSSIYVSDPIWQ